MKELNLDKKSHYLLACSFGPDSMALFYMLVKGGYHFDCAIVNYHLREESDSEVEGLIRYADQFGVKVYALDYKRSLKRNVEARCREIRYSFFSRLYRDNEYDALLVAQHQDDHIETYLMQKQRQNCPVYYGISEKSLHKFMTVIRPLLGFSKKELQDYCDDNKVPYAIDKTNFDTSILRNKIRHEVVAKLSKDERRKLLEEIDKENEELSELLNMIDYDMLNDHLYLKCLGDPALQYALNILAKRVDESACLSKENVGEIRKALFSKKPNIFFKIKKGLYYVQSYDSVEITNKELSIERYSYVLDKPSKLDTPYFSLDFTNRSNNRNVTEGDYPITIRNVESKDYTFVKGYKVSANRLFIDWKMPLRLRSRWPIILDKDNKPLYIPRYQKDFVPSKGFNFIVKTKK